MSLDKKLYRDGSRGFHHPATLCTAACAFPIAERSRFYTSPRLASSNLPDHELEPTRSNLGRALRHHATRLPLCAA